MNEDKVIKIEGSKFKADVLPQRGVLLSRTGLSWTAVRSWCNKNQAPMDGFRRACDSLKLNESDYILEDKYMDSDYVKRYIKEHGLTQHQAATLIGISQGALSGALSTGYFKTKNFWKLRLKLENDNVHIKHYTNELNKGEQNLFNLEADAKTDDTKKNEPDLINHPPHYNRDGAMECIDEMKLIFGDEAVYHYCICNAWKYRYRAGSKDGESGEKDLKKSDWYLNTAKNIKESKED